MRIRKSNRLMPFWIAVFPMLLFYACSQDKIVEERTFLKHWYDAPASDWNEALLIDNRRMGAIAYGGIDKEHLQLNEET